jgi:hypothetical protein
LLESKAALFLRKDRLIGQLFTPRADKQGTGMKGAKTKKQLSPEQREELLRALKARFEKNMNRHERLEWAKVKAKLEANSEKLWSLREMERTGGEPDVVGLDQKTGEYIFFDCSPESPKGRTSVCYDREGLESRKEHRPKNTAMDMAMAMGIELLTEEQYQELQKLGDFDRKTSSWVKTPADIRKLEGALYCDRRYGRVFVGHNGAQSYYSARGFRGTKSLDLSALTLSALAILSFSLLLFLRENSRWTTPFVNHLFFRRVELKNYSPASKLKFILRGCFERGSGLTTRLNE